MGNEHLTKAEGKEQSTLMKFFWLAGIVFAIFMWLGTQSGEETFYFTLGFMSVLLIAGSFL